MRQGLFRFINRAKQKPKHNVTLSRPHNQQGCLVPWVLLGGGCVTLTSAVRGSKPTKGPQHIGGPSKHCRESSLPAVSKGTAHHHPWPVFGTSSLWPRADPGAPKGKADHLKPLSQRSVVSTTHTPKTPSHLSIVFVFHNP